MVLNVHRNHCEEVTLVEFMYLVFRKSAEIVVVVSCGIFQALGNSPPPPPPLFIFNFYSVDILGKFVFSKRQGDGQNSGYTGR